MSEHLGARHVTPWARYISPLRQKTKNLRGLHSPSELLQPLLTLIRSEAFRKVVEQEGYDSSVMGEVVHPTERLRTET